MNKRRIKEKIIVSFTSFPARILCACDVAKLMLKQTVKVDKVVLCLAESQFPGKVLPREFNAIKDKRFEILWGEDIRPHKKYYYAMLKYPDAIVITVDDDISYPLDLVEHLLELYVKYPRAVSCLRGHTIKLKDAYSFSEYREWHDFTKITNEPSLLALPTGVGGVLYPPHIFPDTLFDIEVIKEKCLITDDLWLKWCALINGVPCVMSDSGFNMSYIEDSQEQSLWKSNLNQNHNDEAWNSITEWYREKDKESYDAIMAALYKEFYERFELPKLNYLKEVEKGTARVNISVVMPVYNTENFLRQTIDSVLGQTMYKLELICVDDGSTDSSVDIIREYMAKDPRVKLVQQANLYAGCARNNGLQHAKGDYVYFMDSDDWLETTAFEQLYPLVETTREDILIFFHYTNNEETGEEKTAPKYYKNNKALKGVYSVNFKQAPEHFLYNTVVPWNKIYRRDFVVDNGFKFAPLQSANDRAFYFETITKAENVKIYNNFLLHYRIGNDSSISSKGRLKRFDVHFKSMQDILARCANVSEADYLMLIDVCMRDMFEFFEKADGLLKLKIWRQLEEFFADLDIPYSDAKVSSKYFKWYEDYLSIKNYLVPQDDIIISLSADSGNISGVYKSVTSLLMQSLHDVKIILWLSENKFPNGLDDVPEELVELTSENFEIEFCKDCGAYNNILPALRKYSNSIIITADENTVYGYDMAKRLYCAYLENKKCVYAYRASYVFYLSNNKIFDVDDCNIAVTDIMNKPDTTCPVLYPVGSLKESMFRLPRGRYRFGEDKSLWLWSLNLLAGYRTYAIERNEPHDDEQEQSTVNVAKRLGRVFGIYPQLKQILRSAHSAAEVKLLYLGTMQSKCYDLRKKLSRLRGDLISDFAKKLIMPGAAADSGISKYDEVASLKNWLRITHGIEADIGHPSTYTEKNQWLKLFGNQKIRGMLSDRRKQRAWLAGLVGKEYVPELYKVYYAADKINFTELPPAYSIGCTHFSSLNIAVPDGNKINKNELIAKLDGYMHKNYGVLPSKELQYKKIKPRIMIEELLDIRGRYRVICINGKPEFVVVFAEGERADARSIYDTAWKKCPFIMGAPVLGDDLPRPGYLDDMVSLSEKCASSFPVLGVDFCVTAENKLKITGITFTPNSGVGNFLPAVFDNYYGEKLQIG